MSPTILEIKNLTVELDKEKIIDNFSFSVQQGDIVAILGPNGAGKTVLLRTLLGLMPFSGQVSWLKPLRKGYVPQRLPLVKGIPITVAEFFKLKGIKNYQESEESVLRSVGLEKGILKRPMNLLTPGQYQRTLMAWQLMSNPEVVFFDEPMEGIDVSGQQSIYRLLEKIHLEKNLTIFLVSHDLSVVYQFASKVICLSRNLVCAGMPKEALTAEMLGQLYGGETKFYQHHHD
ncbi:MAG: metal ABC transporter ATP-binding protein [Patescibacteria group bacterium]|nr:metal ABC transporter ATP-binding protein [Patescibacteria group bacterium]